MFDFLFDLLPHFGFDAHHDAVHHTVDSHAVTHTNFGADGGTDALQQLPAMMKKLESGDGNVDVKSLGNTLRELTKLADSLGDLQGKLDGLSPGQ